MSEYPPPPSLGRLLLQRALPADVRDDIAEDLAEVYRRTCHQRDVRSARRWYLREALTFSVGFAAERLRERIVGRPAIAHQQNRRGVLRRIVDDWTTDFSHAARRLRRARVFTAVTVGTLALAIGANTAIFSVVDAVLIDPLPYPDADHLVVIRGSAPASDLPSEFGVGAEFYLSYREAAAIEQIGMFAGAQTTVRSDNRADRLFIVQATPSLFATLGVKPLLGQLPAPHNEQDRGEIALISHELWTTWFASAPGVIGRSIEVTGRRVTVVGVMGPEFRFPDKRVSLWLRAPVLNEGGIRPGGRSFGVVARVRPGVTTADLSADLARIVRRLPERWGGDAQYVRFLSQYRPVVRTLEEQITGRIARPLWIVLGTMAIVFLIACANVANLFIVRTESRRRDLAVRNALGAGRAGLIRSQMAEAVVLAVCGGALGALIAWISVPALVTAAPEGVPNIDLVRLTPLAVAFNVLLAGCAACVFGLLPAVRFSRPKAVGDLRQSGRIGSPHGRLLRHGLVVLQTACALVLLVGAGLLARSFWTLSHVDLGFKTDDIFTFQVAPQRSSLNDGPSFAQFHQGLMDRLRTIPGVESVGLVNELPLDEGAASGRFVTEAIDAAGGNPPSVYFSATGGDYFKTMGIPLVSGRLFESADHQVGTSNLLVSRSAAQRFWPNENAIGKRLRMSPEPGTGTWHTVVGVVGDVRLENFRQATPDPMVYLPMVGPEPRSWGVGSPAYVVRSARAAQLEPEIRAVIHEYAPEAPMYRIFTMEYLANRTLAQLSFTMVVLLVASGLALVLGAVGLYGVLSYVVAQRAREIAVRLALGAEVATVRRMVVVQGGTVAMIGVTIGIVVALAGSGVLRSLLFGVDTFDPLTFIGMSVLMIIVAALASYIPAHRASAVDPMQALRGE